MSELILYTDETGKYFERENVDKRRPRKMSLVKLHSWKESFSESLSETDGKQTMQKLEQEKIIEKENHRKLLWIDTSSS